MHNLGKYRQWRDSLNRVPTETEVIAKFVEMGFREDYAKKLASWNNR